MIENRTHLNYRRDIDGLRAISVLAVVAFHAFPDSIKGGFIGVDVFFVISGYLISTIIFKSLDNGDFSIFEFYERRVRRIFPALLVVLSTCFVIGWLLLLPDDFQQLGKHIAGGAVFSSNFVLWRESGYFETSAETKPLLHLWSLGIEEQFYIVWPLLLWLAWKRNLNLMLITVVSFTSSFVLNLRGIKSDAVATFYSPQSRFWEILAGCALAWFTLYQKDLPANTDTKSSARFSSFLFRNGERNKSKNFANVMSFFGFLLLLCGFFRFSNATQYPGKWALVPVVGSVLIIAAGANAWLNRRILSNEVLVLVGLISFPLYLWHWPLLVFARTVYGEVLDVKTRTGCVVIAFVLAWLTHKFIEHPLRSGKRSKNKIFFLVSVMVLIGVIGYQTFENSGWEFRFPDTVQDIEGFKYRYELDYRESTCFLRPEQTFNDFGDCQSFGLENNMFLWGDSYAAHLFPGINKRYASTSNISQYTASGCPPYSGFQSETRIHCFAINNYVIDLISTNKPNTVILSARWNTYGDLSQIDKTIEMLKSIEIENIVVVGPVPEWTSSLPDQLIVHFESSSLHAIPARLETGLDPEFIKTDEFLKDHLKSSEVLYISARNILCNSSGCMTKTGSKIETITAWDHGHLTKVGSEFLVSKFPNL